MLSLDRMLDIKQLLIDRKSYHTANIFGVIVYTVENPHIVKVLRDSDYWDSLNARTKGWILYAIRPDDHYAHLTEGYLLPQLGVAAKRVLPCLIIFAVGPNQEIYQREYPIEDKDIEAAYDSIKRTVKLVTNSVKEILSQYLLGPNVYREVVKSLDAELALKQWKIVSVEVKKWVQSMFSLSGGALRV